MRSLRAPALALVVAALLAGCSSGSDVAEPSPTTTPTATAGTSQSASVAPSSDAAASSAPAAPAVTATAVGTATLEPVRVGEADDFGSGLTARVTSLEEQRLTAQAPGEVSGPGVVVALEIRNGSPDPIDLDGLTVTASYGEDQPANPLTGPPADVPTGVLAPGASASGTWTFSVPSSDADSVRVFISSISSPNVIAVTR